MKKTIGWMSASLAAVILATPMALGAAPFGKGHGGMMFDALDADKDGVVTKAEATARAKERFASLDANSDGKIILSELPETLPVPEGRQERMEKMRDLMEERHCGDLPKRLEKRMDNRMEPPTRMKFMAKMDKNGDEVVTLEEFTSRPLKHFEHMDKDGDGKVTKAEAEKARAAMKDHYKKKKGHKDCKK